MKKQLMLMAALLLVAQAAVHADSNRGGSSQKITVTNKTNMPIEVSLDERLRTDEAPHLLQSGKSVELYSREKGARGISASVQKSWLEETNMERRNNDKKKLVIKDVYQKLNANYGYDVVVKLMEDKQNPNNPKLIISVQEMGSR